MKHYIQVVLMTSLGGLIGAASAGEPVDRQASVNADPVVRILNTRGDVEIVGTGENLVTVTGELDDLAESLIFDADQDRVLIEVKMPKRDVNWGDGSDLRIRVPRASRVSFEGVSTDLEVREVQGGAQLRTVSGDIQLRDMSGRLVVNSVSGDIEIAGSEGRTSVSSISGDLDIKMNGVELDFETVSGDVDIEMTDITRLTGRSVSGEVDVNGRLIGKGEIDLNSVSGDIGLQLSEPVNASLRIKSGIGGDIRNGLTDESPRDVFPSQQELVTIVGDGSGTIRVGTVSADVRLK
ncbi:MAG: DUF4097 domain-containing protein [Pseudomonadota bacterium]